MVGRTNCFLEQLSRSTVRNASFSCCRLVKGSPCVRFCSHARTRTCFHARRAYVTRIQRERFRFIEHPRAVSSCWSLNRLGSDTNRPEGVEVKRWSVHLKWPRNERLRTRTKNVTVRPDATRHHYYLTRDLSRDAVSYNRDASRLMTLKMRIKLWPRRRFAGE